MPAAGEVIRESAVTEKPSELAHGDPGQRPERRTGDDVERDAVRLLEELRIHQVELQMQNEELVATRHALEESLRRYTELFDRAPIGYLVLETDGRIRDLNVAAARLLGVPRGAAAGRRLGAFVADADAAALARFLGAVLTGDDDAAPPGPLELTLALASGAPVVVRLTGAAVAGADAAPAALLAAEDVTARRMAEDAVRDALQRRDDFLGTLSHELRNPLSPIRNALALLRRGPPLDAATARAIAVIDRQSAHLSRLVDDLLDVTRIARGKVQLRRAVLDLRGLVQRTVEDHRAAFEAAGVALTLDAGEAPRWVDADPTRVAQVLGNVLGNALKFTGRGGQVAVALREEGGAVRLAVRDSGAGIEPELQARLFEPFSQGTQTLARASGGLGLGLATVKGLVELHGGTVAVVSPGPGRGTEVTVTLPQTGAPSPGPAPVPAPSSRRRVLVVDDNVDGAVTLKDVLEASGHEVRVAHHGPGALQVAREFLPDAVVCDLGLPGMDGFAVARAIRADPALAPTHLVALSGYARPEDVGRSREAGFDHHVAKPPALDELLGHLAAVPARPR
jgi:two-component system CheB/CheR fusion protein